MAVFAYLLQARPEFVPSPDKVMHQLSMGDSQSFKSVRAWGNKLFNRFVSDDMLRQAADVEFKAKNAVNEAGKAVAGAQEILSSDASVSEKIAKLTHNIEMYSLPDNLVQAYDNYQSLYTHPMGQMVMRDAVSKLNDLLAENGVNNAQGMEDEAMKLGGEASSLDVNQILSDFLAQQQETAKENPEVEDVTKAGEQAQAVETVLGDVPKENLKAAALLLAFTQFRSAVNRDNQSFGEDLSLLQKLVGDKDPALNAALTRLAPHAEEGVLTPGGLSNELRSMTGEIVLASLKGEKVSIVDETDSHFGKMLKSEDMVEPDQDNSAAALKAQADQGNDVQANIAQAQSLLNEGDIAGAINAMERLDGPAAQAVQPWLEKASLSNTAQQVKYMVAHTISGATGSIPYTAQ